MPITIDIEKDYLYNLGLKKADDIVKKAKEMAFKAKRQAEQLAREKAAFEAKAKANIKMSIQKMQATNTLLDEEIMEFLNLDEKTFQAYLKEIAQKQR